MTARKPKRTLLEDVEAAIPSNWLDPLLSGPRSVVTHNTDCREIEALMTSIRFRVRRAFAKHAKGKRR